MSSVHHSDRSVALRPAVGGDFEQVMGLLGAADLPAAGVPASLADFFVAEDRSQIVGAIGIERYGQDALLRSAVVAPVARGTGVGAALVRRLLGHARECGVVELYLLTTTAEQYFPRFGFVQIARAEVPDGVRGSVEFREACPASAVVMRRMLDPEEVQR